jgi:hypothetical protein
VDPGSNPAGAVTSFSLWIHTSGGRGRGGSDIRSMSSIRPICKCRCPPLTVTPLSSSQWSDWGTIALGIWYPSPPFFCPYVTKTRQAHRAGLRIRITLMRIQIRIQLFTSIRIRIQLFNLIRIRIQLLFEVNGNLRRPLVYRPSRAPFLVSRPPL